jgi:hypothetical protein
VAITEDDIALIPEIVAAPDEVIKGEAGNGGNDLIVFKKKIGDAYVYVQEEREGRKKLVAKTLWKARIAQPAATKVGAAHTSKTIDRSLSTGNHILPLKHGFKADLFVFMSFAFLLRGDLWAWLSYWRKPEQGKPPPCKGLNRLSFHPFHRQKTKVE